MLDGVDSLQTELAELALQIDDQNEFRSAWMRYLAPRFGFDNAAVFSTRDGKAYVTQTFHSELAPLKRELVAYVSEFEPHELATAMAGRTVFQDEIFPGSRLDQLRVFREYCRPHRMGSTAARSWLRDGTIFFIFFSRRVTAQPFETDHLRAFDRLFPLISLGEVLHANRAKAPSGRALEVLAKLTTAEASVVALAQRGLTSPEIARITGRKPNTVRNQLCSAYDKLNVSNRTELAFILADTDAGRRPPRDTSRSAIERLLAGGHAGGA